MKIPLVDLQTNYKIYQTEYDEAIKKVTSTSSFIIGPQVEEFEQNFAKYCETKYCAGLDSGISALELGMRALGIGQGDEVITPVNSFIASSSAISFTGAKPVWVDVDSKTYNIDPSEIEGKITNKTKAIMPVHLYGQSADMTSIAKIAKKHKLFIIEDACQAHGAKYKNKRVGSFGDFAAFSFYPGKNLGAFGDAGALVTNNKSLYKKISQMRNYGQTKKYHHEFLAWNRRLDSIQASVLNIKLKYLDLWNKKRLEAAQMYQNLLSDLPITLPFIDPKAVHVFHLFVIQSPKRNKILSYLHDHDIQVGIHYPIPIHKQIAYKNGKENPSFEKTEKMANRLLSLPIYPEITKDQLEYVSKKIHEFFKS